MQCPACSSHLSRGKTFFYDWFNWLDLVVVLSSACAAGLQFRMLVGLKFGFGVEVHIPDRTSRTVGLQCVMTQSHAVLVALTLPRSDVDPV